MYVATVNRVGLEGSPDSGLNFWGQSFVCDPQGRMLAEASHNAEEVVVVRCSSAVLEEQRRGWPFLRDRRIDTYASITKRFLDLSAVTSDPAER